jgi:hypothetical protein
MQPKNAYRYITNGRHTDRRTGTIVYDNNLTYAGLAICDDVLKGLFEIPMPIMSDEYY